MNNMNQNMERNEYTQNLEHGTPKHSRPRRKNQGFLRRITALTLSAALFGAVSAGTFYGVSALLPQENSSAAPVSAASTGAVLTSLASTSYSSTRYGMDVSDIAAAALPSVVSITNISVQEVQSFFKRFGPNGAGQTQLQETTNCGSGIIIANDGTWLYMVTNAHVVEDATTLSVSFVDNAVYEAQLCGTDEDADLAVIKVAVSDLSSDIFIGRPLNAIGKGKGQKTMGRIFSCLFDIAFRKSAFLRQLLNQLRIVAGNAQLFRSLPADGASAAAEFPADGNNAIFHAILTPSALSF